MASFVIGFFITIPIILWWLLQNIDVFKFEENAEVDKEEEKVEEEEKNGGEEIGDEEKGVRYLNKVTPMTVAHNMNKDCVRTAKLPMHNLNYVDETSKI